MKKVRTAVLVSAGVASGLTSGLVMSAAAPAGAIGMVGGGVCSAGDPYIVSGQVNSGPDAGDQLAGTLCIQSAARGVTVLGAVRELQRFNDPAPQTAVVPVPAGFPLDVSGTTARLNIRFDGRFRGAFVQATGSQVPALPDNTFATTAVRRVLPSYGGTFNGFQRGDVGVWRADPADIARST
jgi:hypothetical protein